MLLNPVLVLVTFGLLACASDDATHRALHPSQCLDLCRMAVQDSDMIGACTRGCTLFRSSAAECSFHCSSLSNLDSEACALGCSGAEVMQSLAHVHPSPLHHSIREHCVLAVDTSSVEACEAMVDKPRSTHSTCSEACSLQFFHDMDVEACISGCNQVVSIRRRALIQSAAYSLKSSLLSGGSIENLA
jgi:hypothetical protein